jgi:hypothetical protein
LVGPSGWSRRSLLEGFFISDPILFRIIERIDHFRDEFIRLGDLEHSTSILVSTTVVSS